MEISRGRGYLNLKMVIKHEWRSRLISFALANNSLGGKHYAQNQGNARGHV